MENNLIGESLPEDNLETKVIVVQKSWPKKKIGLVFLGTICIIILYYLRLPIWNTVFPAPVSIITSPPKTINLTLKKTADLQDPNAGVYIQQDEAICDQEHLGQVLGKLLVPGDAGRPLQNTKRTPLYGETTWWYKIQGTISAVKPIENNIQYQLTKDNDTLLILANERTSFLKIENLNQQHTHNKTDQEVVTQKLTSDTLKPGDKVLAYLTVKCGGNKAPLLFFDTVEKIPVFITKEMAIEIIKDTFANTSCILNGNNQI